MNALAQMVYRLGDHCSTFQSDIGLDAEAKGAGTVDFQVWADNVMLYDSGVITGSSPTKTVRVGLNGYQTLQLVVTDAQDGITNDVADWATLRSSADRERPSNHTYASPASKRMFAVVTALMVGPKLLISGKVAL